MTNLYIVQAKRSPMGSFQGSLSSLSSPALAAHIIQSLKQNHDHYDEIIMGCVLSAGIGQAPARQAAILGGLSHHVNATTVNKVCGSGLKALMIGCDQLALNHAQSILAGGMESMSNAPYLLQKARTGYRMGHNEIIDHMMRDGLEDAYPEDSKSPRTSMGLFAEKTVEKYGFTRDDLDQFSIDSFKKYTNAHDNGFFKNEIIPLSHNNTVLLDHDEPPTKVKIEKIPNLKPAFKKDGLLTAATSSSIADGAAVLHIVNETYLKNHPHLQPLARICGYSSHAHEPEWFTTAPIGAMETLMKKTGWALNEVDLFEINEAFSVVTMAATQHLHLDPAKVNIHGGACALGHPIGASGARVLVTLLHALRTHNLKRGVASLCIGGGEAVAMAIEAL